MARRFGATDVVSERGDDAIARVRELTGGPGAHSVLECVGHGESMRTAVGIARAGGAVGRVGVLFRAVKSQAADREIGELIIVPRAHPR